MSDNINHPVSIGKKIEKLRKMKGMKQEGLASATGLSRQTISRIEQSLDVDDEKLEKIAQALGYTVDAIKNYNDELTNNFIQNNYDGSKQYYSGLRDCNIYPSENLMELVEENRRLYQEVIQSERELVKSEREKNALLQIILEMERENAKAK